MALTKNLTNQLSREFHVNLTNNNFDFIKNDIIDKYKDLLENTDNKGLITSILRYGIKTKNDKIINSVVNKLSMKRDFYDLMLYYNNESLSIMLFKNHFNIDLILTEDIDFMIKNNLHFLLQFLDGKFIQVSGENTLLKFDNLKKYKLTNCDKYFTTISDKINKEYINSFLIALEKPYDCIIDAGNVLHSRNGEVNFQDLETVIKNFENPLIIIHKRHKLKNMLKNYNYFETPYNVNDDLFILLAYLKNNCKIITNDKYSDHTFESNDFRFHVMDDIINYTNKAGTITFNEVKPYSKCIQIISSTIYLPTKDGFIAIEKK